jgi:hypothetical protein
MKCVRTVLAVLASALFGACGGGYGGGTHTAPIATTTATSYACWAAFGVTVERGADGIPDAHSNFIYVLDRSGRLQTTLALSSHSVPELRAALAG